MTPVDQIRLVKLDELQRGEVFFSTEDGRPKFLCGIVSGDVTSTLDLSNFHLVPIKSMPSQRGYTLPTRIFVDHASFRPMGTGNDYGVQPGTVMIHSKGWAIFGTDRNRDGYWIQAGDDPEEGERGMVSSAWRIEELAEGGAGLVIAEWTAKQE